MIDFLVEETETSPNREISCMACIRNSSLSQSKVILGFQVSLINVEVLQYRKYELPVHHASHVANLGMGSLVPIKKLTCVFYWSYNLWYRSRGA